MEAPSSPPRKPSAIPRLSRLPIPKPAEKRPVSVSIPRTRPAASSNASTTSSASSRIVSSRTSISSTRTSVSTPKNSPIETTFRRPGLPASQRKGSASDSNNEDTDGPQTPKLRLRSSRLSLLDRTKETLAQVPPSPASVRRRSSIFPESPASPRSGSSQSNRPSSRENKRAPAPTPLRNPKTRASISATPNRRSISVATPKVTRAVSPTKASVLRSVERVQPSLAAVKAAARAALAAESPSNSPFFIPVTSTPADINPTSTPSTPVPAAKARPFRGSKTVAARAPQQRPPLAGLFEPNSKEPSTKLDVPEKPAHELRASKSSAALREQIRKAKAERKTQPKKDLFPADFDFDNADPFNQGKDGPSPVQLRVDAARIDGRLNISAMVLKTIPDEVLNMYDYETNKASTTMWNEVVDLVRFVAADNEIETIPDTVFPDADDPDKAPQFGGVEHLDLHGNLLFDVPVGLRRLEHLTTLNLSRNRLMNDALETIAQISSLRELRMGDNLLTGELASSIETLTNLEVLDVQGNKLSRLPDELGLLTRLRVLNVSNNRLTELPMLALSKLPLVEILASKNAISGTLFPPEATGMPRLQTLDVSVNQLRAFCGSAFAVDLPTLKTLNIAFNSIAALPGLAGWTALITILAEDNKFAFLPDGFTEAHSLRNVDFTGNNFVRLDEHIGLMESLEGFKIAANPLRERKFLTMSTEELKHDLRARLAPPSHVDD